MFHDKNKAKHCFFSLPPCLIIQKFTASGVKGRLAMRVGWH